MSEKDSKQAAREFGERVKRFNIRFSMSEVWNRYVDNIKYSNRFFPDDEFKGYLSILLDFNTTISTGKQLYRARRIDTKHYIDMDITNISEENNDSGIHGLRIKDMKEPPKEFATSGRGNPAGVSYLYLASNPQTACAEIRPVMLDLISVSKFKIIKRLHIININLTRINLKQYSGSEREKSFSFLMSVMKAFSMPNNEKNDIEYAPSQYIAAYLQANGIDGIKYISMLDMKENSYNLVLFKPEMAECLDEFGQVFRCAQEQRSFQNISTFDKQILKVKARPVIMEKKNISEMNIYLSEHIRKEKNKDGIFNI